MKREFFVGTRRFIEDLEAGCLRLPSQDELQREPRVTPRQEPDLSRPFPDICARQDSSLPGAAKSANPVA